MAEHARLLMVDDNPADQDLARFAIDEADLKVELATAVDGIEGKAVLERIRDRQIAPVAAVLLDLNMPRMDGRRLLAWARAQPALAGLPIIIFTSSYSQRERADCLQMGATDYWVKPSDFGAYVSLIARLRQYIERGTAADG